jgi:hypothetical protein
MKEQHNKQYQSDSRDDSTVSVQENNLVLLQTKPRKDIDESINTPERYVSWYQSRANNIDKYLDICPHCKKPTMTAFHRTVINSAVDYLEGKRMFASYIPNRKHSSPTLYFLLALGTGAYFLLNHVVSIVKG